MHSTMTQISTRLILVLLLVPSIARAQTPSATVRGIVIDQTDARLTDVRITITRDETSEERRTTSDGSGRFAIAELPTGGYTLRAERAGFSVFRQRVELAVGSNVWIQARLAVSTTAVVTTGA